MVLVKISYTFAEEFEVEADADMDNIRDEAMGEADGIAQDHGLTVIKVEVHTVA